MGTDVPWPRREGRGRRAGRLRRPRAQVRRAAEGGEALALGGLEQPPVEGRHVTTSRSCDRGRARSRTATAAPSCTASMPRRPCSTASRPATRSSTRTRAVRRPAGLELGQPVVAAGRRRPPSGAARRASAEHASGKVMTLDVASDASSNQRRARSAPSSSMTSFTNALVSR